MKLAVCVGAFGLLLSFGALADGSSSEFAQEIKKCDFHKSEISRSTCYKNAAKKIAAKQKANISIPEDLTQAEVEEVAVQATTIAIRNSPEFTAKVRRCMAIKKPAGADIACLNRK